MQRFITDNGPAARLAQFRAIVAQAERERAAVRSLFGLGPVGGTDDDEGRTLLAVFDNERKRKRLG
jgi:hypothetical protein